MNKKRYFRKLKFLLRTLPHGERERILQFYREILEDKIERGVPEEDALNELGDVHRVAQKILEENPGRIRRFPGKTVVIVLVSFFGVVLIAALTANVLGGIAYKQVKVGITNVSSSVLAPSDSSVGEETKTYTAAAGDVDTVEVNAESKRIEFVSTDQNEVTIRYCPAANQTYTFSNQYGVVSITNEDLSGKEKFPNFRFDGSAVDPAELITVSIPENFAGGIKVEAKNCAISAADFTQLLNFCCDTTNAAIGFSDVSAQNIDLQSKNATISLENVSATVQLSAQTENAAISLQQIDSPDIVLTTKNAMIGGSILGREEDYTIDVQTSNAVSNLTNRTGGEKKLTVHTSNAMIGIQFQDE